MPPLSESATETEQGAPLNQIVSNTTGQKLQQAVALHAQGNVELAKILYLDVLKTLPGEFNALHYLGMIETQAGNLEAALSLLSQAVKANPQSVDALNNFAYVQQLLGHVTQALASYEQALQLNPRDIGILNNLGLLLKQLQRMPEALAAFDRALLVNPTHVDILCNRGNVLQHMGRAEDALANYDLALKLAPNNVVVLNNKSTALSDLLRNEEALAICDQAIAISPDYAQAWADRGTALRNLDRTKEAVESFRRALAIDPALLKAQVNLASICVSDPDHAELGIQESRKSLRMFLNTEFRQGGKGAVRAGFPKFRLKHDLQQAAYLQARGYEIAGTAQFVDTGHKLLDQQCDAGNSDFISIAPNELALLMPYLAAEHVFEMPVLKTTCLNPENDWQALEDAYLKATPEILYIDNFLSKEALQAFRDFGLLSKVWLKEYVNSYLGAFANQGFVSPLHLQLARELKQKMPRIFKDYSLNQLWGFKYDATLGKGINVHADFAKVNLNFWLTPSEYNLDPASGGLKVYDVPAPANWTFQEYNADAKVIYEFLAKHQSGHVTVPHRGNRAVLFNSALFHETDTIRFVEGYESRRINMTYLFGRQLW